MIGPFGRLAVRLAHEAVTEWRRLDTPEPEGGQEMSCVSADTERAAAWDHDKRRPVVAAKLGFGKQ